MKRRNTSRWMRRVIAGFLSVSLIMAGILVLPEAAEAAEASTGDAIEYEKVTRTEGTVPVKDGYLFGGWYKDAEGKNAVKQDETYTGDIFAKFVPSYVLSVKAQVDDGASKANDGLAANMRILTSLDSMDYQCVGVQVGLGNKNVQEYETTKVYDNLVVNTGDNAKTAAAKEVFGVASKYFGAWKITNISDVNDNKIVYVRPYWVTLDGTKVYGLAKYVHVEDSYKNYVSVSVNLMSGVDAAAGLVSVGYDSSYLEFVEVENGRVFNDEMAEDHSVVGTVKVVGNGANVGTYSSEESLFANLRFRLITPDILYETDVNKIMTRQTFLTFGISGVEFCDWDEDTVNAGVWNVQY